MQKLEQASDFEGRPVRRGDTVSTLNGQLTARVSDIAGEGETVFVRLRPLHQPYGKGTWHAADRLIWVASATRRTRKSRRGQGETKPEPEPEQAEAAEPTDERDKPAQKAEHGGE